MWFQQCWVEIPPPKVLLNDILPTIPTHSTQHPFKIQGAKLQKRKKQHLLKFSWVEVSPPQWKGVMGWQRRLRNFSRMHRCGGVIFWGGDIRAFRPKCSDICRDLPICPDVGGSFFEGVTSAQIRVSRLISAHFALNAQMWGGHILRGGHPRKSVKHSLLGVWG